MIRNNKWRVVLLGTIFSVLVGYSGKAFAQATPRSLEKDFKVYLKLFPPLKLPLKAFEDKPSKKQGQNISQKWIEKFIDPKYENDGTLYTAMGQVKHQKGNIFLFIGRGAPGMMNAEVFLLVYTPSGILLQQLLFNKTRSVRNTIYSSLSEDLYIKLTHAYTDLSERTRVTEVFQFMINEQGRLIRVSKDRWNFLKEITPLTQYCNIVRAYYQQLSKQNYKAAANYFSPQVSQWLGLKNVTKEKVGNEAHRFLSSKKQVFYYPDFTQAKIKNKTLTVPVKLGWNNYRTEVVAYFTFNKKFEITHLKEQSQ